MAEPRPSGARQGQFASAVRRWPPVQAFALFMLGLTALVGLIVGLAALTTQPAAAAVFLASAVAAAAAGWLFARGERRGYWAAVVILGLIGAAPTALAIAAGAGASAVVFTPPLVVAGLLLRPKVRAQLITKPRQGAGTSTD